ncbi:transporter substrate-binding domain-containing protein [Endozoicomonas sp. SM1973]|uniref:Transporter substrate-binding domain-containing protein n=1 Tax=Spartinivicinus marinus TaxID=2994442 RepID=A0A853IE76_9GAMM|nr:transporter substrate-binding domain-containing protein [Spartinivicinus marinus]MCX4028404.1 transporter substrate-binding domain-containing protein [Spartinivicinus marinus]NYZ67485.1 transporter substrate-binding domain-containing protein [Spartinivicinus marinus]
MAKENLILAGGEWPPYVSKELNHYGVTPRIITEIFSSFGVKVQYQFHPWSRSLEAARQGIVDGTFLWYKTPEREKDFYYSKYPIGHITFVFFHLKSTPFTWKNYSDLRGYRIGATISYHYGEQFIQEEKKGKLQVIRVKSDEQNLKMLLKERIDIFPHDLSVGYFEINKIFPRSTVHMFTNHPQPLKKENTYLLLSKQNKNNKQLIKLFSDALYKFTQAGKYEQYYYDDLIKNVYTIKNN